jgi:hypothetical protein
MQKICGLRSRYSENNPENRDEKNQTNFSKY